MTKTWLIVVGILVAVLGIAAVACSDDPSEAELTIALCRDLVDLQVADAAYDTLGADSSLDDLRSVNSAYASALDDVLDSARALGDVRVEAINAAYGDLNQTVSGFSSDTTISEGLTAIESAVVGIGDAYEALFASVPCSP